MIFTPAGYSGWFKLSIIVAILAVSGCAYFEQKPKPVPSRYNWEPIVIRVTGYGAFSPTKGRISDVDRLKAIRASKLDAYRALAERVYGTSIMGSSTVRDFVLKNDNFRTIVDSEIRGAKVVSVLDNKRGAIETVMELKLNPRFRECLTQVNRFRYSSECRLPLPHGNDKTAGVQQLVPENTNDSLYYLK